MLEAEKTALQRSIAETRERMHLLEVEEAEKRQRQEARFSLPKVRSAQRK